MVHVVLSQQQRAVVALAQKEKRPVELTLSPAQMKTRKGRGTVDIPLAANQRAMYEACLDAGQPFVVVLHPSQLRGGWLSELVGLATKVLPAIAKAVLPKLALSAATGATSALASAGIRKLLGPSDKPQQTGSGLRRTISVPADLAAQARDVLAVTAEKANPLNSVNHLVMGVAGPSRSTAPGVPLASARGQPATAVLRVLTPQLPSRIMPLTHAKPGAPTAQVVRAFLH